MPSVCAADLPPIPTLEQVNAKASHGEHMTPLDKFVLSHSGYAPIGDLRTDLTAALHWYVEEHKRLWHENMGNKRREELRAGFDHAPAEDEGSQL